MKKRTIDIAVISDVHLGTFGCHAEELLAYLSSINPEMLILNGNILDVWGKHRRYFPQTHLKVVKKIINLASNGTRVIHIPGDHDRILRKFSGTVIGNYSMVNELVLEIDGKKAWFFHGAVVDVSARHSRWLARFGNFGYNCLLFTNRIYNWGLIKLRKKDDDLASRLKKRGPKDIGRSGNFERNTAGLAISKGFDYVVCGHIHEPKKQLYQTKTGQCTYLNSGDWLDSLTALEYSFKRWKVYTYSHDKLSPFFADEELKEMDINELIANIIDLKLSPNQKKEKDGESIGD